MTIPRNRPAGGYAGTTTIASAEFEHFDKYLSEAIHGKGGTYSLAQELILGGDDVVFTESIEVGGNATVANDLSVGDDLDVAGNIVCAGSIEVTNDIILGDDLSVAGNIDVTGSITVGADITIGDDASIAGSLLVTSSASFGADMEIDGALTVDGNVSFVGNYFLGDAASTGELYGDVQLRGILQLQGSSAIKARTVLHSTDADATYSPLSCTHVHVPGSTVLTADRNAQIDDTGAQNGMRLEFSSKVAGFYLNVLRPGGTTVVQIRANAGSNNSAIVERIAGSWEVAHTMQTNP